MVNQNALGGIHNQPVQTNSSRPGSIGHYIANSIEFIIFSVDFPFEAAKAIVILLVENGPGALAEVNPAEGVAIAEKAKDEQWKGENTVKPIRNTYVNHCHFISPFFYH
jgi:hypothetical protein